MKLGLHYSKCYNENHAIVTQKTLAAAYSQEDQSKQWQWGWSFYSEPLRFPFSGPQNFYVKCTKLMATITRRPHFDLYLTYLLTGALAYSVYLIYHDLKKEVLKFKFLSDDTEYQGPDSYEMYANWTDNWTSNWNESNNI